MSDALKALERIVDYISDIESDIYGQPAYNIDLDIETIRAAITEQAETGVNDIDVVDIPESGLLPFQEILRS